jgi:hypothetical protein
VLGVQVQTTEGTYSGLKSQLELVIDSSTSASIQMTAVHANNSKFSGDSCLEASSSSQNL